MVFELQAQYGKLQERRAARQVPARGEASKKTTLNAMVRNEGQGIQADETVLERTCDAPPVT